MAPRKRTAQEIAQDKAEPVKKRGKGAGITTKTVSAPGTRKRKSRASRSATKKPPTSKRLTAPQITARNAEIARLREVYAWPWQEIADRFGIWPQAAREGYASHISSREQEASFEQAMEDMRAYLETIQQHRKALAVIALDLPEPPPLDGRADTVEIVDGKVVAVTTVRHDERVRIAATHEHVELIFKEIAIRQAIGDLPMEFGQLIASRDFDAVMDQVLALLNERGLPREVFAEIEEIIAGRLSVAVPKTHLAAVEG